MKKKVLGVILILILLLGLGGGAYYYFVKRENATSFTKAEKEWIQNNKLKLIDIGIENDVPVLNNVGDGLVFDFLKDFETATGLEFNRISYSYSEQVNAAYKFKISKKVAANQIQIYEDNYILLTTENKKIKDSTAITGLKIGVLKDDLSDIRSYLAGLNDDVTGYEKLTDLSDALGLGEKDAEVDGILIPKLLAFKYALDEKTHITYLVTDLTTNYVIELGSNDKLNTIIKKYYTKWKDEKFTEEFNKYFTKCYFEFSGTDQNSMAAFKGKRYTYGYIENAPYNVTLGKELYGTSKEVLDTFASVADIEINYKKYDNFDALLKAFDSGNVDLFLNNTEKTGYDLNGFVSSDAFKNEVVVISKSNVESNITSIRSLKDKKVATLKDSNLSKSLNTVGAKITEYKTVEELVDSKENIIILDFATYDYYKKSNFGNYKVEFIENSEDGYGYTMKSVAANSIFNEYFDFYLKVMNQNEEIGLGNNKLLTKINNKALIKSICLITGLALVYIATIIFTSQMNKNKQPSISFKKSEKIKYMDMLTSLKNRNYLNDNMDKWEESQVYPQAIVIIDLNNIAYINDNYGHNAGDDEIKEAANVLIKNQVINSDIVRTNGNEFLIYLVGYKDRQIELYIKKLNKELKELKHGFGAAIGYSMITDDIKTIDDAINEATIEMRKVKEETNDQKDVE